MAFKSLNLSAPGNVGFNMGGSYAAGREQSIDDGRFAVSYSGEVTSISLRTALPLTR